jgi:hypothetical protein
MKIGVSGASGHLGSSPDAKKTLQRFVIPRATRSNNVTPEQTTTETATNEESRNHAGNYSAGSLHGGCLGLRHALHDVTIVKIGRSSPKLSV